MYLKCESDFFMRNLTILDKVIRQVDNTLRLFSLTPAPSRPNPSANEPEQNLSQDEQKISVALMRVNRAGEIAAQALYQGQSLFTRDPELSLKLSQAAEEELDHIVWCQNRIDELGGRNSYLDPFWYLGAYCIGAVAGFAGDSINLGFLAETENQVVKHLNGHLERISPNDTRSQKILIAMRDDEAHHENTARENGGINLPFPIPHLMTLSSKVMTTIAYWV